MIPLVTERLVLRAWRADDRTPFAALNADPQVLRFYPATLSEAESDALADRMEAVFKEHGFTVFPVEEKASGRFVGAIGLKPVADIVPIAPAIEVAWRLIPDVWGRGYAPEAARAALDFGFEAHGLTEIVAYTTRANAPSRRVMDKLGMVRDAASDFDHPSLPADHALSRHVVYRLPRSVWEAAPSR